MSCLDKDLSWRTLSQGNGEDKRVYPILGKTRTCLPPLIGQWAEMEIEIETSRWSQTGLKSLAETITPILRLSYLFISEKATSHFN